MNLKNTFGKLGAVLLASAAIGLTPIKAHSQNILQSAVDAYSTEYNGDKIIFLRLKNLFVEEPRPGLRMVSNVQNVICVDKPNGKRILYVDLWGDDLKVDRIGIEENGNATQYDNNGDNEMMIREGQKKFKEYLRIVKEARAKELLE